jgi:hypothetical protein
MPLSLAPGIPLPKSWTNQVRLALVHVISLALFSVTDAAPGSRWRAKQKPSPRFAVPAAIG